MPTESYGFDLSLFFSVKINSLILNSSAYDSVLNEKVAIKKVFKIFEHDREFQKRILREIKILKHFDHENVCIFTILKIVEHFFIFFAIDHLLDGFNSTKK